MTWKRIEDGIIYYRIERLVGTHLWVLTQGVAELQYRLARPSVAQILRAMRRTMRDHVEIERAKALAEAHEYPVQPVPGWMEP